MSSWIKSVDWNGGTRVLLSSTPFAAERRSSKEKFKAFCGNSVTPETTGSGHAREKRRARNGNQRPFVRKGVLKLEIISVHPNI